MPIHHADASPPAGMPPGYVGPFVLPATGRPIYWTGRVAIGIRHTPVRAPHPISCTSARLQTALLRRDRA